MSSFQIIKKELTNFILGLIFGYKIVYLLINYWIQMPQLLSVFASCSLLCLPSLLFIQARVTVMEDGEGDLKEI